MFSPWALSEVDISSTYSPGGTGFNSSSRTRLLSCSVEISLRWLSLTGKALCDVLESKREVNFKDLLTIVLFLSPKTAYSCFVFLLKAKITDESWLSTCGVMVLSLKSFDAAFSSLGFISSCFSQKQKGPGRTELPENSYPRE